MNVSCRGWLMGMALGGMAVLISVEAAVDQGAVGGEAPAWPTPTRTMRPWTRWWWPGNAVDAPNLIRQLGEFHDAGLGGVEILALYGARGYESRFIDFLSPK